MLELETELARVQEELIRVQQAAEEKLAGVRKQYKPELVPLRQAITLWEGKRRR